uniref:oxysterol-binding protein-related protein 6-like isoform X2 n=1 Tax=Styela clava TaxID=7725 RepID=UPI001939E1B9|nr:oxysterol-binding protein-related protein 6-like isoform X2 [Styela clava]
MLKMEMEDNPNIPKKYEGYVLKRRKWPLKGWHKRFFVLEKGFMKYAKSPHDIVKGKLHGILDVGLSVMSTQKKSCRIDLDAEDTIFHLKIKSQATFQQWVTEIRSHREYRQAEMKNDTTLIGSDGVDSHVASPIREPSSDSEIVSESTVEDVATDLRTVRNEIEKLRKLLQGIKSGPAWSPMKPPATLNMSTMSKKERKMSKKASKKLQKAGSMHAPASTPELASEVFKAPSAPVLPISDQSNLSKSNPDIALTSTQSTTSVNSISSSDQNITPPRPQNLSKSTHSTPTHGTQSVPVISFSVGDDSNNNLTPEDRFNMHDQFLENAAKVCSSLDAMLETILKQEQNQQQQQNNQIGGNLRKVVTQLTKENKEMGKENKDLKTKLQMISQISSQIGPTAGSTPVTSLNHRKGALHQKILSNMSLDSQLSISETMSDMFYDAEEYLLSDAEESSTDGESENEDDDDAASTDAELSEGESTSLQSIPIDLEGITGTGRRTKLPCYRPEGGDFSLWNILRKNIGKDLSRVSMPVTLNEPLNALQCLCEELEYSDLLDKAVQCEDPYERMVHVAAFAVSAYASTHTRAGQKPFNPLLGETYECLREDKDFKFVAEQVSHHPPISACHCSSEHYEFWQDARWKNKFWGKSMEILPMGSVHLKIPKFNDEYKWNKVTTCVHNIMSGTRWVEHYGEMIITNKDITCKIVFSKSGYWNSKNGEIAGTVTDSSGEAQQHMHGRWFESIYTGTGNKAKCIWRKSGMPTDYDRYYGFTQFAMELNELETADVNFLPRTDTRFRPDQRYLEEGNIDGAEKEKQRIEQMQRDRKKQRDENKEEYSPKFFKKVSSDSKDESWVYNGEYWKRRKEPGFVNCPDILTLW